LSDPILFAPLLVAVILIVVGRVKHRTGWGNWVAVAGYAVLAVTIVIGVVTRG
jgi:hypothetical protein